MLRSAPGSFRLGGFRGAKSPRVLGRRRLRGDTVLSGAGWCHGVLLFLTLSVAVLSKCVGYMPPADTSACGGGAGGGRCGNQQLEANAVAYEQAIAEPIEFFRAGREPRRRPRPAGRGGGMPFGRVTPLARDYAPLPLSSDNRARVESIAASRCSLRTRFPVWPAYSPYKGAERMIPGG